MSHGYIYLSFKDNTRPDLEAFESLFEAIDLRLEQPLTQQMFALSPIGSQLTVTREWITTQLGDRQDISIQWWYSDGGDVYCRYNPNMHDEQWRVEFGLDGVEEDKVELLVERVLHYFKECCARGEVAGLVVDRSGDLEETNWDAVVGGLETLQDVPDILVLPRGVAAVCTVAAGDDMSECPQHTMLMRREF